MKKLQFQHDVLMLDSAEGLIVSTDNSGAIGEKKLDKVHTSYDVVAYYLFRVAYMDLVAAGGRPKALILQNFNGDAAWTSLVQGLEQGMTEAKLPPLNITGSSESNFDLQQSATSLSLIGHRTKEENQLWHEQLKAHYSVAVIGKPLVGEELFESPEDIASLEKFTWLSQQAEVIALIPVGSKGIQAELAKIDAHLGVYFSKELDLEKTAGPATCYIVMYHQDFDKKLEESLSDPIFRGSWENKN